jgi:hypothetical protein
MRYQIITPPTAIPMKNVESKYTHPYPTTSLRPAEGEDVAGAELWLDAVSEASTVTTTTLGVAVVVALPLLEVDVEGVEEVGEGVLLDEYPAGNVDTFGIVVEPVADDTDPGNAAKPTAGGLKRYTE